MKTQRTALSFCIVWLAIAFSLVNAALLGTQSLTAYFGFTIIASFAAIFFGITVSLNSDKPWVLLPVHILIFIILAFYVFVHGLLMGNLGIIHYYWATGAVFLLGIFYWQSTSNATDISKIITAGISLLAFVESIIVLLQYLQAVPSKNPLFPCTGTWVNPNVTALFLAMSIFAILRSVVSYGNNKIPYVVLFTVLLAIILLQCRTAYIVVMIFIIGRYGQSIIAFAKNRFGIDKKMSILVVGMFFLLFIGVATFRFKSASTDGRLYVWKNCLALIAKQPLFGHGFGMFEKAYNLFVAQNKLPSNGHVSMPYNDFLELGVEGGIVAILLWCGFLFTILRYCIKSNRSALPVIAFCIVELVNFGFQAIPAFALFLAYIGTSSGIQQSYNPEKRISGKFFMVFRYVFPFVALLMILHQLNLASAFYKKNEVAKSYLRGGAIEILGNLDKTLQNYPSFHEAYGDAYFKSRQYILATQQYMLAAKTSSSPDIFSKCGRCYQLQNNYDSSEYFYSLVEAIEPHKYIPRMALLKLYQQKGDSLLMLQKAREIVDMPIKVESEKVEKIKAYAIALLNKNRTGFPNQ